MRLILAPHDTYLKSFIYTRPIDNTDYLNCIFAYVCVVILRDLKYIIGVAKTRHFGKAADRCVVSHLTLSRHVQVA